MDPTIAETVYALVIGVICLAFMLIAPHINPYYDPKGKGTKAYMDLAKEILSKQ